VIDLSRSLPLVSVLALSLCCSTSGHAQQFTTAKQFVFNNPAQYDIRLSSLVDIADLNQDGRTDVVVSFYDSHFINDILGVETQNSDGTFTLANIMNLPNAYNGATNGPPAFGNHMALGDMDGDGKPDLIVCVPSTIDGGGNPVGNSHVYIYLGNGDGTFRAYSDFLVDATPSLSPVVVDLNGDGHMDLLFVIAQSLGGSSYEDYELKAYVNQGNGSSFTAGNAVYGMELLTTADLNGDGKADLVTTTISQQVGPNSGLNIMLGDGHGSFTAGAKYAINPTLAAVGDLNRDGHMDIVASTPDKSTILLGNGTGTFSTAGTVNTSLFNGQTIFLNPTQTIAHTNYLFVKDVNGDGIPDVLVEDMAHGIGITNFYDEERSGLLAVFQGNGNGTFQNPRAYNIGDDLILNPILTDFYHNGHLSLFYWDYVSDINNPNPALQEGTGYAVLNSDGKGNFNGPVVTTSFDPTSIAAGDFNKDGIQDVAVVNLGTCQTCNGRVSVFGGSGQSYLNAAKIYDIGLHNGVISAGDVNGDGKLDLVVTRRGVLNQPAAHQSSYDLSVLLGNGDGTFLPAMNFTVLGPPASGVHSPFAALADVNHDGKLDLVGDWGVALGKGTGEFFAPIHLPSSIKNIASISAADLNGDKQLDLAIVTSPTADGSVPATVYTLYGNGTGSFSIHSHEQHANLTDLGGILATDINGDGIPDLLFTTWLSNYPTSSANLGIELGKSGGTYAPETDIPTRSTPIQIYVGDFNRDGLPDIVLSSTMVWYPSTEYLRGTGKGTFAPAVQLPVSMSVLAILNLNSDAAPDVAGTTPAGIVRLINTGSK
jgi:FG-GAP-like repeat